MLMHIFFSFIIFCFLCLLIRYVLNKFLKSKYIFKYLQPQFADMLTNKVKPLDIIKNIFSYKYIKMVILTISLVTFINIIFFFYSGYFMYSATLDISLHVIFLYILCITFCINISICYIYSINFFTKFNLCCFIYSFILLFISKLLFVYLMHIIVHLSCIDY